MVLVSNEARLTFCSNVWEESVKDSWCFFLWHWCGCLLNQLRFFGKKKKPKKQNGDIFNCQRKEIRKQARHYITQNHLALFLIRIREGTSLSNEAWFSLNRNPLQNIWHPRHVLFNSGIKLLSGRAELLRRRPWNVTQWMTLDIIQASFHGQH